MVKKILVLALISAMILSVSGCKEKKEEIVPSSTPIAEVKGEQKLDTEENVQPTEEPQIVTENVEKDFSGLWVMTHTSSKNANFESLMVDIDYEGYNVRMTFLKSEMNTSYEGEYKIKDGVLIFDKNFEDCTAYFYEGSDDTLVLDNGISQVFCKRVEED